MDKLNRWNKSWGKVDWNKNSDELIEQKIIDFHNAGIDFNMEKDNATGLTPLHLAALYGRAKLIKPLIDFGADPDAEAYMGNGLNYKTPLMLASSKGHSATVKELIKCGAHVNYKTVNNFSNGRATALAYAVLYGHPETVKLLIEAGACEIKSALSVESENNNAKIKKLLENADKIRIAYLEEQANVKKAVKQKLKNQKQLDSQLHTAATYGDLSKVKTLVARGANVNSKNASNQTPVMMAVAKNHANVANFLVENGANVNLKDSDGKSALLNAVLADRVELIDTLIKHGADMYEKIDADGNSLLHIAVKENCTKSIKALLKNGFDEYTANETGDMALHTAAVIGNNEAVIIFLDHNPNMIEATGQNEHTALYKAVSYNQLSVAKTLIERDAFYFDFNLPIASKEMAQLFINDDKIRADYQQNQPTIIAKHNVNNVADGKQHE